MVWPLVLGVGVAGALVGGRVVFNAMRRMKGGGQAAAGALKGGAAGKMNARKFYEGGFQDKMDKKEAALILGCREHASKQKIIERFRSLTMANHPDRGGSPQLMLKVNEAKEMLYARAPDEDVGGGSSRRRARK